jgi:membrane-bound lytic murein transglycosylase D
MGRDLFRRKNLKSLRISCWALAFLAGASFTPLGAVTAEYHSIGIPIPESSTVDAYRLSYADGYGHERIVRILEKGIVYRAYIRQRLAETGLPPCFEYLPIIESEYNPHAVSSSGAVGLWQFMENSIKNYLEKNGWIDERLDPWKATDAAIKKLQANYAQFDDWALALAAYNSGAGAIQRALASTGTTTFWELTQTGAIKEQTRNYVPKFLAIADLIMNAGYYDLSFPEIPHGYYFETDVVPLNSPVYISKFCEEMGLDRSVFDYLNPALLKEITPPTQNFPVRVPANTGDMARRAAYSAAAGRHSEYVVKQGDTLWRIARNYEISIGELCSINNLDEKRILTVGIVLSVPIK